MSSAALTQIVPVILEDLLTIRADVPSVLHESQCLPSITGTQQYQPGLLRAAFLQLLTPNEGKDFSLTPLMDQLHQGWTPLRPLSASYTVVCCQPVGLRPMQNSLH